MLKVFIPVASILAVVLLNASYSPAPIRQPNPTLPKAIFRDSSDNDRNRRCAAIRRIRNKAVKVLLLREIQLDETARFMLVVLLAIDNKEAGRRFPGPVGISLRRS